MKPKEIFMYYGKYYEFQEKLATFPLDYTPTVEELGIELRGGKYQQIFRDIKELKKVGQLEGDIKIVDFLCILSMEMVITTFRKEQDLDSLGSLPDKLIKMAEKGKSFEILNMIRLAKRNRDFILKSEGLENFTEIVFGGMEIEGLTVEEAKNKFKVKILMYLKVMDIMLSTASKKSEKVDFMKVAHVIYDNLLENLNLK